MDTSVIGTLAPGMIAKREMYPVERSAFHDDQVCRAPDQAQVAGERQRIPRPVRVSRLPSRQTPRIMMTAGALPMLLLRNSVTGARNEARSGKRL